MTFENLCVPLYLLFVTQEHRLHCLPLRQLPLGPGSPGRRVGRGARLVCSVAGHSKTVLQMPRGNLEVIQPRPLALQLIADLLVGSAF